MKTEQKDVGLTKFQNTVLQQHVCIAVEVLDGLRV